MTTGPTTETTGTETTGTETTETETKTTQTTSTAVGEAPGGSGGGGGGNGGGVPDGRPDPPPEMNLPPTGEGEGGAAAQPVVPAVPGVAAAGLALAPIALPVIVAPPLAPPIPRLAPGVGGGGGGPGPGGGSGPKPVAPPRAGREPAPVAGGGNVAVPASYRVGYVEYLRTAGMTQIAAVAVPGVAGLLLLTGAGGLLGYRQAKAGHSVRSGGTGRFVN